MNDVEWSAELDGRIRDGEAANRNMMIASGVGVACLALGGAMYYASARGAKRQESARLSVMPVAAPAMTGIAVTAQY